MCRLSLAVWLPLASVSHADLLMSYTYWGQGTIFPATTSATIAVSAPFVNYPLVVNSADVGKTFVLPVDIAQGFVSRYTAPEDVVNDQRLLSAGCCYGPSSFISSIDASQSGGDAVNGFNFQRFAPVRDFRLHGYTIDSIALTVDALSFDPGPYGKHTTISARYTTSFYGYPIPPLPGDFNIDGNVSAADYVTWRNSLNSVTPLPNGTGTVPWYPDRDIWLANFGRSVPHTAALSAAIPEPSTMLSTPEPPAIMLVALLLSVLTFWISTKPIKRHKQKSAALTDGDHGL